jgi:hypothetical protein
VNREMYVVCGQVHPIVQWFAIDTSPWQHLDQFEFFSFANVVKDKKIPFLNMKKFSICQTMFMSIIRIKC